MRNIIIGLATVGVLGTLTIVGGLPQRIIGDRVESGHAVLLVNNYGSDSGVQNAQVFTGGRITYDPWTQDLISFPTSLQTKNFEEKTQNQIIFSVNGSPVTMQVGVSYRFNPSALPEYFSLYRLAPEVFNDTILSNALRDCGTAAASGQDLIKLSTEPHTFQAPLLECLQGKFKDFIEVREISFLSNLGLPPKIQESVDRASQAQQDALTAQSNAKKAEAEGLARKAEADADAAVTLIKARAEADANEIVQQSLTDELVLFRQQQYAHEERMAEITKWNGQYGTVVQTPNVQLGNNGNTTAAQPAQ